MSDLKKTLDELEQMPGARSEGHMSWTLTIGNQTRSFRANHVFVNLQHEALRFFGLQIDPQDSEKRVGVQVQLQPESIESGSYDLDGPNVKDIIYFDAELGGEYTADQGAVDFNRSVSLEHVFGAIKARFNIDGQEASIIGQYDIRGWGIK